jgi:hypothetical protein
MKSHNALDNKCNFVSGGGEKRYSKESQIMKLIVDMRIAFLTNGSLTVM